MIYLDNNATTQIDRRVYLKQCEILNKYYGNPSSLYPFGVVINQLIQQARFSVAKLINANLDAGDRIVFTSCATESNNTVFHSFLCSHPENKHIIVSAVEHPSVLNTAAFYEKLGCHVSYVGVNENGLINEDELVSAINNDTVLVSIMLVNSETGIINNISHLSHVIKEKNPQIIFHTDAVQAAGKIPIDVSLLGVDLLTLSGHKFHAPKGVGALYIKSGINISPFLLGGHQENGLRAGTENTASIVALGEAAELANNRLNSGQLEKAEFLRNYMEDIIRKEFPDSMIFGKNAPRVYNTTNVGFKNIDGVNLVLQLAKRNICISSGTACNSKSAEPSYVLQAMNVPIEYIRSVRISLYHDTTMEEIQEFITALKALIK